MPTPKETEQLLMRRIARLGLVLGTVALVLLIFSPFVSVVAWATVLSYLLYPIQRRLVRLTGGRKSLSAVLTCLGMTLIMILPLLVLSFLIGQELVDTYHALRELSQHARGPDSWWHRLPFGPTLQRQVTDYERLTGQDVHALIVKNVGDFVSALAGSLTSVATNLVLRLFDLGFTVLCCFFFLRDGETLVARVEEMLPFSKHRQQVVLHRFDQVVTGSIYGNTAVALLEGVVGGSAFYAAGLHSPALWGTVMGLLSYLPVGGAALIWVPGAVYLFYQAAYVKCAGLCLAGVLIAVIDHAVRNALLAHRVRLHPLLVFCSVLGGVQLFGLLGLVVGPLIVAIAQTMLDVFRPALAEAAQHPAEGP